MWGGGRHHRFDFCGVISVENILYAWKKFRKGKRSKVDVRAFEFGLEENIFDLYYHLISGTWKPDPYVIFYVQDPKLRKIHKATVRDRVLYQLMYLYLYQIFDKSFIHDSYSSRKIKGTHLGIKRFEEFSRIVTKNYTQIAFTLKCDIRKFFDSIDHDTLISLINKKIKDEKLMSLIVQIIDSFHTTNRKGLPLGNVTSQIMANIYLNELDQFCKHTLKTEYYIRYCDDFVILHNSREFLESLIDKLQSFLTNKLRLTLHPRKVTIRKIKSGIDFLGYVLLPHYKVLRTKTKNRILKKISRMKYLYEKGQIDKEYFEQSIQSYLGVLSHCKSEKIVESISRIFLD